MTRKECFRISHEPISTNALKELHASIATLLKKEDATPKEKHEYFVREHADWKEQADVLEEILAERGEAFKKIDW